MKPSKRVRTAARRKGRRRSHRGYRPHLRKTFGECQDFFLTSWFWRTLHGVVGSETAARWKVKPLVMIALLMLFSNGRSVGERFDECRCWWNRMHPNRKRPGKTVEGFHAALARMPRAALKAGQPILRQRIAQVLADRWHVGGWIPFGVDGSRLELPRRVDLERVFGTSGKGETPQLWLTALVHLSTGIPWAWQFGTSKSSERALARRMLDCLPPQALLVADAGFTGLDFWQTLEDRGTSFLIRLSSQCHFYVDYEVEADFSEGFAWLWPQSARNKSPMRLRIIRLAGKEGRKDVWLATNVMESTRLSRADASEMFRARWEHEVFYRGYKRTLDRAKLSSRTAKQAIREVEIAMMGTQLLLAQTQWALARAGTPGKPSVAAAVRQVGHEMRCLLIGQKGTGYLLRLAKAAREQRPDRTSPKATREWPRKNKAHKPPGPPNFHPLDESLKTEIANALQKNQAA